MAVTYSQNGVIVRQNDDIDIIGSRKYKTAMMPDGKIWLAENLDFKFCNVGGSDVPTTANAWYYNNDETTYGWNGYKCGLLYNWYAVKVLNDNRADLMTGWHVPTKDEWDSLNTACGGASVAGQKLKALDGSAGTNWPSNWNGTDDYGFKGLPAGGVLGDNTFFFSIGDRGYYWTATASSNSDSYYVRLINDENVITVPTDPKTYGYSLRLVRDT